MSQLSPDEWEKLCDGCGQCCHEKYEDEETGDFYTSNIACSLFDSELCRCTDYTNRQQQVPDCLSIRDMDSTQYRWLPKQCAYRLRSLGLPLPVWHPLCSGDSNSVHHAGISMRGRSV